MDSPEGHGLSQYPTGTCILRLKLPRKDGVSSLHVPFTSQMFLVCQAVKIYNLNQNFALRMSQEKWTPEREFGPNCCCLACVWRILSQRQKWQDKRSLAQLQVTSFSPRLQLPRNLSAKRPWPRMALCSVLVVKTGVIYSVGPRDTAV